MAGASTSSTGWTATTPSSSLSGSCTTLNKAANLPPLTNHYSFSVSSKEELAEWKEKWRKAGLRVFEIDHNWCHSIYTTDPNGNGVEFCLTTGTFDKADRERALAALDETEFKPSPPPALVKFWEPEPA